MLQAVGVEHAGPTTETTIGDAISYGPSLVPEVSAIDARNYSPYELHRMPTNSGRAVGNPEAVKW